jgi:hypothetical protein
MQQILDPKEWPSIRFEGEFLPQSLSGISILIDRNLSERTSDWIWRLPHCKETWKDGEAAWCISSATEIIDHMLEHEDEIAEEVKVRLGSHGFDGQRTVEEWLGALARIRVLSESADEICRWIAGEPSDKAEEQRRRLLAFLDKQSSNNT